MKKLITILFLFIGFISCAQLPTTGSKTAVKVSGGVGGFTDTIPLSERLTNTANEVALKLSSNGNGGSLVGLTKTQVGLSNVDNTSDAVKNSATAILTNKTLNSPIINNPIGIVKSDIGLNNVDNTTDANKPVSTPQQSALNAKENVIVAGIPSQYWRGDKTFQTLDKSTIGLSSVDNTSDINKPISTLQQNAINLKANLASPSLTGVPLVPTAALGTKTTQIASTEFVDTTAKKIVRDSLISIKDSIALRDIITYGFGINVSSSVSLGITTIVVKRDTTQKSFSEKADSAAIVRESKVSFTQQVSTNALATPVASTTYYFGASPHSGGMVTGSTQKGIVLPFACRLVGYSFAGRSSIASVPANPIILSIVNITTTTTSTLNNTFVFTGASTNTAYANNLNIIFAAGDQFQLKLDTPAWSTVPTNIEPYVVLYFQNL